MAFVRRGMAKSMLGRRKGKLTILKVLDSGPHLNRGPLYYCQCDCGNFCERNGKNMSSNIKNIACPECMGADDLSGKRCGKLTIIKKDGMIGHNVAYQCICDCGNAYRGTSCGLRTGVLKSCGCGRYDKSMILDPDRRKALLKKEYGNMNRRNEKDLGFPPSDLSFNDFRYISSLNCFYCDKQPSNETKDGYSKSFQSDYILKWTGIDRLDPKGGYFKNNVVPCCGRCNKMKDQLSLEEFDDLAEAHYIHHGQK